MAIWRHLSPLYLLKWYIPRLDITSSLPMWEYNIMWSHVPLSYNTYASLIGFTTTSTLTYLWWFITSHTKNLRCWVEQIIYFTTTYFHFHYDHYICHASFLMQIHCNTLYLNCHTCTHWEPMYLWDKHRYID